MVLQIIAAVAATAAFAVLFGVPARYYPYCGLIGGAGWAVYLFALDGLGAAGASFAATVIVVFISRFAAIRKKCPVTIFLISGILPLVPGAGVYWMAYYLVTEQFDLASSAGYEAVKIAFAIVLGIVFELPQGVFRRLPGARGNGQL